MNAVKLCLALTCCLLTAVSAADAQGPPPLGPRHIDSVHGFSIRPPAGAQTKREPSVTTMVSFNLLDSKTGAIRIWMKLSEVVEHKFDTGDLAAYARALADRLEVYDRFKADRAKLAVTTVAGKRAIDMQGVLGGTTQVYQRQMWIETKPSTFLLFTASGPLDAGEEVVSLSSACLATLELFDPEAFRKKREQDLAAGAKLLEGLSPASLNQALAPRDYWLAILKGERMIGFVHYHEEAADRLDSRGLLVVSETVVAETNQPEVMTKRSMYASADRTVEKWDTYAVVTPPGGQAQVSRQYGIKQADVLLIQDVLSASRTKDHTKKLPVEIYVPQAMEPLLARLIDRTQPGAYAFAVYGPATDGIEMRTITVIGPEKINLGGRSFDAVRLTDQLAADAPLTQVWVDAAGLPLKVVSEDGMMLQATTAEAVQARFPQQWQKVHALGQ